MSTINLDFVQTNQPSFFVHFAYANVSEEMISQTLEALNLGDIREISFKPATNKKNERGNSIVVHFNQWFRNPTSDKVRQKLFSGESIKINYNPKAYLQVIAFQSKTKVPDAQPRAFKQPTITFDDDFGPKLGLDCCEKYNTSKVKCDERELKTRPTRNERPVSDERPTRNERPTKNERPTRNDDKQQPTREQKLRNDRPKRPTTPEGPPPEAKPVIYKYHNTRPDVFDMNKDIACKGVLLPRLNKQQTQKKPINFQDSPSDSEDDEFIVEEINDELEALYGDIDKIDLNK